MLGRRMNDDFFLEVCRHMCCALERQSTENPHNKQEATTQHALDGGDLNTKARIKITVQNMRSQHKLGQTNECG